MSINYPDTKLFIDGKWQDAKNGKKIDVKNPATGQIIGQVARAEVIDLDLALKATEKGFIIWKNTSPHDRQIIIRKAVELMRQRADRLAELMTLEQGKPLAEAKAEVLGGAAITEWFADEAVRLYGRIIPSKFSYISQQVIKEPVGPVVAFTPWNFPINQIVRKMGSALAAGCSFLCKAPRETPASPAALIKCFIDAGIPDGVIGLVFGASSEISNYLIASPIIRKVTFTGSTVVGKQLASLAGQYMKRCTMELGGHAPVIIAEDADINLAVQAIAPAKLRNAGQVCISPTRFLVHNSRKAEFTETAVKYFENVKVGNGLNADTKMGPLANERQINTMKALVEDAKNQGAKILFGGKSLFNEGNFYAPTILSDVPLTAKVFNDEPFGPLLSVKGFDKLDEAIKEANRLPYGLAAYAFTSSLKNANQLSQQVETGMLWINQAALTSGELPFGGIKDSGYGSEGGIEALDTYLNAKVVSIAMK